MPAGEVRTTCAYCGVGCGILASNGAGGPEVRGDPAHPANHGRLCSKGSALASTLAGAGRVLRPRIGDREASWNEALDTVASRLRRTIAEHGPDSVAFYVSGQLLTEDYYVANKLMKGFLGAANIDTNSRLCMSSSVVAHQRAFGEDVVPGCYEDLETADLVVLVGSNTAWCHPVLFRRLEEARRLRPSMRVVVIDPRRTATCEGADLHLALRAGSDVALFAGLLHWLHRGGFVDTAFTGNHTLGLQDALAATEATCGTISRVAAACGLDEGEVRRFYDWFATTPRTVTAFSQGVNQSSSGSDKASAILNVHLATGRIGKEGCGPFSLTGQPNAMGGREVGGLANTLAAHLKLEDDEHRRLVQEFWKSPAMASAPGWKAVDLFEAVRDGRVKALWIMATNPVVSLPDADTVREALQRCPFVVVSECFSPTDTSVFADVLLPAATWGEKDGTVTNSERRISRQRRFVDAPGEARPDWWIVSQVAIRMGHAEAFGYETPHEIFLEHCRLTTIANDGTRALDLGGLADLSADEYEAMGPACWPLPHRGHPGTRRLFADGAFFHPDGRARVVATVPQSPVHACDADFPFVLNTGRIRDQWHSMTRSGRVPRLVEHCSEPFVEVSAVDAAQANLLHGDLAFVRTRWGSATLKVRVTEDVPQGMLFAPIHWSDTNASRARVGALVNPVVDPHSGEPEFKHTPAALEKVPVTWHAVMFERDGTSAPPTGSWWTRMAGEGHVRHEVAGTGPVPDLDAWPALGNDRRSIGEYRDPAANVHRAFRVTDGRLESCVFVGPRQTLPSREWVATLFAKPQAGPLDGAALLAGQATAAEGHDSSAVVCACHGVRRSAIETAIDARSLDSVAAIGRCLGAGTGCGSCLPELACVLREKRSGQRLAC